MQEVLETMDRGADPSSGGEAAPSFLTIELAGQVFAIPVTKVRRIHDPLPIARLPQAAHGVEGVVDIDGESVVLADLAGPLGMGMGGDPAEDSRLVILQIGDPPRPLGVTAEKVLDVVGIRPSEVEPVPKGGPENGAVIGIARIAGTMVMLLDIERVLGQPADDPFAFD
ncbi:MAG: chemotaxis protein CheW [Pseudomonadota bacterium]